MSKTGWREFDNSCEPKGDQSSNALQQSKDQLPVRVYKTRAGKRGKLVTVIKGLDFMNNLEAKRLLKGLKASCGTGGTLKTDSLELQGDQVIRALDFLKEEGYRPKQSGG